MQKKSMKLLLLRSLRWRSKLSPELKRRKVRMPQFGQLFQTRIPQKCLLHDPVYEYAITIILVSVVILIILLYPPLNSTSAQDDPAARPT
jgi:hypothetical protein